MKFAKKLLACFACLLLTETAVAEVTTFRDKVEFLTLVGGQQYNDPYPSEGHGTLTEESRWVTFNAIIGSTLSFGEWESSFPGIDLGISGVENLNIDIIAPVGAIGWDMSDDNGYSQFEITLTRDGESVTQQTLETDGSLEFFGIWSDTAFDGVQIRETTGTDSNEYFGNVYGSLRTNKDDEKNLLALGCQLILLSSYNAGTVASLFAVTPADHGWGLLAYAANLALKACAPWAEAPDDIITLPDNPNAPPNSAAACFKTFDHERVHSGYSNLFGIPTDWQNDWGEMGSPTVYHANTAVEVYMLRDILPPETDTLKLSSLLGDHLAAGGIYSDCDGKKERAEEGFPLCPFAKDRKLKYGVGRNTQTYRFDVNMGLLDLVYIWAPKWPQGTKNKALLDLGMDLALLVVDSVWSVALGGWRFGNYVDRDQLIIVRDLVAPSIDKTVADHNGDDKINAADQAFVDNVFIEADQIGGVSASRFQGQLRAMFDVSDACNRTTNMRSIFPNEELRVFWPVMTTETDTSFDITWQASDPGPNADGLPNITTRIQHINVVDTRPPVMQPPMDIVELTDELLVTPDLGQPLVFDLVDLQPVVTNDAVFPMSPGLHVVTWTATDASGNAAEVTQNVTIKNNNIAPEAIAQTGGSREDAVSFEPKIITVEGFDADTDLLNFFIEDYPENGFFVSPLYPFFIEDYRLEATVDDDALAQICEDRFFGGQGGAPFHAEQIRNPRYFSVLDDGTTYVMDYGFVRCRVDLGQSPKYELRIAVFDSSGQFINGKDYENFPDDFYIDSRLSQVYVTIGRQSNSSTTVFDETLNSIRSYNMSSMPQQNSESGETADGNLTIEYAVSAVVDSNGVMYVLDSLGEVYAVRTDTPGDHNVRPEFIGTALKTPNNRARDMAIDSEDNLYVSMNDRIYKISPATKQENGDFVPGALIGWMGFCAADLAPGDQAVCDVANQRSLGYSCTDEWCPGVGPVNTTYIGSEPGQFDDPRGIAIDPRDNLYVTDFNNLRVQRFTPDGFFAGQAESACDGTCFVLGDFGQPHDIAVNSDHFYILDPDTDLLHISQTSPWVEIGDDWATLEYQSNNDFACLFSADCVDDFSFSVSDGVRDPESGMMIRSAPAVVEIEVERNFRAPFATPGIHFTAPEEVPTDITLDGSDPDPLDMLEFEISRQPVHGSISVNGNIATYTSDVDYVGADSFEFTVDDGTFTSAAEEVLITVTDVNDPAVVGIDSPSQLGRGFNVRLTGDVSDPDPEEKHSLKLKWGDGSPDELEGEISPSGITGPIIMGSPGGTGRVLADHRFDSTGFFDVEFCVTDRIDDSGGTKVPTAESIESCTLAPVEVIPMVDVIIAVEGPEALTKGESSNYVITVRNLNPDSGPGLTATGLDLSIMVDSLLVTVAPAGCNLSGNEVHCVLDDLAPGGSVQLNLPIIVPAETNGAFEVNSELSLTVNEPDISDFNIVRLRTPLLASADFAISGNGADQLTDSEDVSLGDGTCVGATTGACNLRAAVMESNMLPGKQTVALGNQVFGLTLDQFTTPDSGFGDLDVIDDLMIIGNGPDNTFIDGNKLDRVFHVHGGATLELVGLSITRGLTAGHEGGNGGAILIEEGGTLILTDVWIYENEAVSGGGAIYSKSTLAESVVIKRSLINNNSAPLNGGGLYLAGPADLSNVTLSGNTSGGSGGGIYTMGELLLTNVTTTGNSALSGGGVAVETATLTLRNTLLAENHADDGPDCWKLPDGIVISGGGNLLGDNSGCTFSGPVSDQTNVNAGLQELSNNGGSSRTHGLYLNSKAIDRGINANCPATDQRGEPRPTDGKGNGISRCDVGAFELSGQPLPDLIFVESFED